MKGIVIFSISKKNTHSISLEQFLKFRHLPRVHMYTHHTSTYHMYIRNGHEIPYKMTRSELTQIQTIFEPMVGVTTASSQTKKVLNVHLLGRKTTSQIERCRISAMQKYVFFDPYPLSPPVYILSHPPFTVAFGVSNRKCLRPKKIELNRRR